MRDDSEVPDGPRAKLKPANENPWYVLMTLYGEGKLPLRSEARDRNRRAWNAWIGQELCDEHIPIAEELYDDAAVDLRAWPGISEDVIDKHYEEWLKRNPSI